MKALFILVHLYFIWNENKSRWHVYALLKSFNYQSKLVIKYVKYCLHFNTIHKCVYSDVTLYFLWFSKNCCHTHVWCWKFAFFVVNFIIIGDQQVNRFISRIFAILPNHKWTSIMVQELSNCPAVFSHPGLYFYTSGIHFCFYFYLICPQTLSTCRLRLKQPQGCLI